MTTTDGKRRPTPAEVLTFEATTPSAYTVGQGADTRIRYHFGLTSTAYHSVLEQLLHPHGPHLRVMLDIDPITTHTLIDRRWHAAQARTRLTGQTRPASPYCQSGGQPGCTCDICY